MIDSHRASHCVYPSSEVVTFYSISTVVLRYRVARDTQSLHDLSFFQRWYILPCPQKRALRAGARTTANRLIKSFMAFRVCAQCARFPNFHEQQRLLSPSLITTEWMELEHESVSSLYVFCTLLIRLIVSSHSVAELVCLYVYKMSRARYLSCRE